MPSSRWVDLSGPVHYVDYGGPAEGPLLVCVHGLGGSLVNWAAVAAGPTESRQVERQNAAGLRQRRGHGRPVDQRASEPMDTDQQGTFSRAAIVDIVNRATQVDPARRWHLGLLA